MVEYDHLAGFEVGGDGAEGDRQIVEGLDVDGGKGQRAQQKAEFLAGDEARGGAEAVLADTEFDVEQGEVVLDLLAIRDVGAWRAVAEGVEPVDLFEAVLHLVRGMARGVEAADDGAHAGADDEVDRYLEVLEHLQHADVGRAACAAAGEDQAYDRAVPYFAVVVLAGFGCLRDRCACRQERQQEQNADGSDSVAIQESSRLER